MTRTSYLRRPLAALLMAAALAASVVIAAVVLASPAWAATTVINTNDSGSGSLRQAINDANATTGVADTINFDQSLSGQTITLTSSQLDITDGAGLTIDGGSANITISGAKQYRVFRVGSGANLTLSNLTVANGASGDVGGGIYNNGTLEVINSTLSGNSVNNAFGGEGGGGIYNTGGTLKVSNSTLSGNSANHGGGITNSFGTLEVINSTLSGNRADFSEFSSGGGIYSSGTLKVSNSTLSGNSANNDGGGIFHYSYPATVSNSTLSGNSASEGGGIHNFAGTLEVINSTLSGNSTPNGGGGGIYSLFGTSTLKNTIMANSPSASGGSCVGTITDGRYNLDSDSENTCGFSTNNNSLSGVDPMLGDLADNGGPTMTHALPEGSPAIDQGNSFEATTDQRGLPRPSDSGGIVDAADGSDIGAFELQAPDTTPPSVKCSGTPSTLRTPANNHKLVTITASVNVTDSGSGPASFTLVSVKSNQADSGLGPDDVPNDIQGWTIGNPDTSGQLRAERYGDPREYTLTYEGKDVAGNTSTCEAKVTVPKG